MADRLGKAWGVRVAGAGTLDRPAAGRRPGSPYVVIEADTLMDCDYARQQLHDIAGLSELAWDYGWESVTNAVGQPALRIKLFPSP